MNAKQLYVVPFRFSHVDGQLFFFFQPLMRLLSLWSSHFVLASLSYIVRQRKLGEREKERKLAEEKENKEKIVMLIDG